MNWKGILGLKAIGMVLVLVLAVTIPVGYVAGTENHHGKLKQATYVAEIRRTAYGVPHIKADDYAGIGFGTGYAQAEDNICEIADRILTVTATRSRYFGLGVSDANLNSDIYYQRLINTGTLERLLNGHPTSIDTPSGNARAIVRGYAAGVSRYIRDTGVENIPDARCRGAEWVREINEIDIWRGNLAGNVVTQLTGVATAEPPTVVSAATRMAAPDELPPVPMLTGSNAYGLGAEVTRRGYGMLLANPHYPWDGINRFYRMHHTIPGQLNVVGGSLMTSSSIGIGHNASMAWTHTVSTARRYGYFELTLVPGDPTSYWYEGGARKMTPIEVTVQVLQLDGSLQPVTRTLYETHYGPMVRTTTFPWTLLKGFALRIAPVGLRSADQYLAIWQAQSVRELHEALGRYQSTGYNTTGADANGEAFYGDMGAIPHVTDQKASDCIISTTGTLQWNSRIPVLDGSRAVCNWGTDPDSAVPGIFGPSALPHLFRNDFVHQANDSYWLTNPNQPITGLPRIFGDEETARSLRTRMGLKMIEERVAGTDGLGAPKFDLKSLQGVMYSNRGLGAEMVRDDLVELCRATGSVEVSGETIDLTQACDVLEAWDLRVNLDSRGAHLFRLFVNNGGLRWKVPFDVNDPVNTPNTLDTSDVRVINALVAAVGTLNLNSIPLNARLGDVQTESRGADRIPIHGGSGAEGVFNVVGATGFQPGLGWTDINTGASFIMSMEFTHHGPRSAGVLTYSQSTNPDSPHYADQTWLYSQKGWDDFRFTEKEVLAGALRTYTVLEGKDDCKNGGWKQFDRPSFANQGQCVNYFATLRGGKKGK